MSWEKKANVWGPPVALECTPKELMPRKTWKGLQPQRYFTCLGGKCLINNTRFKSLERRRSPSLPKEAETGTQSCAMQSTERMLTNTPKPLLQGNLKRLWKQLSPNGCLSIKFPARRTGQAGTRGGLWPKQRSRDKDAHSSGTPSVGDAGQPPKYKENVGLLCTSHPQELQSWQKEPKPQTPPRTSAQLFFFHA